MANKIRIASLAGELGIGGTARQIITIDKYLDRNAFEHFIVLPRSVEGERINDLDQSRLIFVDDYADVSDSLVRHGIDVLYIHRHGRNQPEHDVIAGALPDSIALMELNTFSAFDGGIFGRRCDKHIFVSKTNVLKYLVQNRLKFDFNKQGVVHALIDADHFLSCRPSDSELAEYKRRLGLEGRFVIGRIARPVMGKWDDKTIAFWRQASQADPRLKFLIYGVPQEKKRLLEDSGSADNLIMMEPTYDDKELALFYSAIDVLIQMSPIGECSCGTIAEAMLYGKPIIATQTPFPRVALGRTHTRDNGQIEQIDDGYNGFIVKTAAGAAHAVRELAGNPKLADDFGKKNIAEVLNKYDAKIGIKTLEKIIIDACLEKGKELSADILAYYGGLKYYPDEREIGDWLDGYWIRLKKVHCPDCRDPISDRMAYLGQAAKRKLATLKALASKLK